MLSRSKASQVQSLAGASNERLGLPRDRVRTRQEQPHERLEELLFHRRERPKEVGPNLIANAHSPFRRMRSISQWGYPISSRRQLSLFLIIKPLRFTIHYHTLNSNLLTLLRPRCQLQLQLPLCIDGTSSSILHSKHGLPGSISPSRTRTLAQPSNVDCSLPQRTINHCYLERRQALDNDWNPSSS